jgi:CheY-like chemotaxis protein
MDIKMPIMDGLKTAYHIRKDDEFELDETSLSSRFQLMLMRKTFKNALRRVLMIFL